MGRNFCRAEIRRGDNAGARLRRRALLPVSAVVLAPFALWEFRRKPHAPSRDEWRLALVIGLTLFLGTSLQQAGIETTSATNAGFLTACYVVLTPFAVWALTGARPRAIVVAAGFVSLLGAWLLASGGALGPPECRRCARASC